MEHLNEIHTAYVLYCTIKWAKFQWAKKSETKSKLWKLFKLHANFAHTLEHILMSTDPNIIIIQKRKNTSRNWTQYRKQICNYNYLHVLFALTCIYWCRCMCMDDIVVCLENIDFNYKHTPLFGCEKWFRLLVLIWP